MFLLASCMRSSGFIVLSLHPFAGYVEYVLCMFSVLNVYVICDCCMCMYDCLHLYV